MKLTPKEKAKRAKARDAASLHRWRTRQWEKYAEKFEHALTLTIYLEDRDFADIVPPHFRKLAKPLKEFRRTVAAQRRAEMGWRDREQRLAWRKGHPGQSIANVGWMEIDMWCAEQQRIAREAEAVPSAE